MKTHGDSNLTNFLPFFVNEASSQTAYYEKGVRRHPLHVFAEVAEVEVRRRRHVVVVLNSGGTLPCRRHRAGPVMMINRALGKALHRG